MSLQGQVSLSISYVLSYTVLKIRRGVRDSLRTTLEISPLKHMLWPSVEPSRQEAQHVVFFR